MDIVLLCRVFAISDPLRVTQKRYGYGDARKVHGDEHVPVVGSHPHPSPLTTTSHQGGGASRTRSAYIFVVWLLQKKCFSQRHYYLVQGIAGRVPSSCGEDGVDVRKGVVVRLVKELVQGDVVGWGGISPLSAS